jgi:hypothetical protein
MRPAAGAVKKQLHMTAQQLGLRVIVFDIAPLLDDFDRVRLHR